MAYYMFHVLFQMKNNDSTQEFFVIISQLVVFFAQQSASISLFYPVFISAIYFLLVLNLFSHKFLITLGEKSPNPEARK